MSKLLLLDGNAILHRAYHALPPLTSKKGKQINAVYGFITMLLRVIVDLKPTHIAVAFDSKKPTFRHKVYRQYQAQRPKMKPELAGQFKIIKRVLKAFAIPTYSLVGYEADDVIGTIARQAKSKPKIDEVIIVTGDQDILQLVGRGVKVYMPIRGLSQAKLFGTRAVKERLTILPSQIIDYKALVGDPSDNYPGVPGIGPKTAVELLAKYKNLETIYENLDKIPESIRKKLIKGEELAWLSKKLATIVIKLPIKLDLREAKKWDVQREEAINLFGDLGFKTLSKRVEKFGKQLNKQGQLTLV